MKAAIWTGSEWWAEDFLRNPENLSPIDMSNEEVKLVTGGFGGTGFDD